MRFILGRFYARLPAPVQWCCAKLWALGALLLVLGIIGLSGAEKNDLPAWLTNANLTFLLLGSGMFAASLLNSVVADRYLKWESSRLPAVKDFFHNHHLTELVGQSLGMVLRAAASELKDAADGRTVYRIARHIETNWTAIAGSAAAQRWLFGIQDRQLVAFVRDPHKPALTHRQANELLSLANPDVPGELPAFRDASSLAVVREQIIVRFGEALRQSLKRDFAQRGEGAMGMLLDISSRLLNGSTARAERNEENRAALDEIRRTLKALSTTPATGDPALRGRFDALAGQLESTYAAVREEGRASALRDRITHRRLAWVITGVAALVLLVLGVGWTLRSGQQTTDARLAQIQQRLDAALTPKQADEVPTQRQLAPELIAQVKILLQHGNREQQALAEIALKNHAAADRIIQDLKKDPVAEAFRVLTLEGDNWFNAGEYDRAIGPYEQALALRPKDIQARTNAALAHLQTQRGDTVAHLNRTVELFTGSLILAPAASENWAMTQNNLGIALGTQGERTEGAAGTQLLAEAVTAYRKALEVYTRAALPQGWAMAQNNLGNALGTQGERTEGAAGTQPLAEAVTAFRKALEVYTRAALPQDWATTQSNLGNALRTQGERTEGAAGTQMLAEAVTAYRNALEVYTSEEFSRHHHQVKGSLAKAEAVLARRQRN